MNNKRLNEIKTRKQEIRQMLEDTSKDVNLEEISKELDNLNNEENQIQERLKIAMSLEVDGMDPDKKESAPTVDDEEKGDNEGEGGNNNMPKEEKKRKQMSREVRSFLRYMMTAGKETRGVTLANGQAVVPEELADEIITEMREVSDVMDFINLKNVRGILRVGKMTAIEANQDEDGDSITAKGGLTSDVTFGSYRTSAKIELGVGLDAESIEAFREIVVSELALALAIKLEAQVMQGTGTNEAKGMFVEDYPSTQKISVTEENFGHKVLASLKGKIRRAYGKRASYVVNTETFHDKIEGMVDANGRPIYDDATELLLKKPVIISDEAPKDKILFGYGKRYWYNYNMAPQVASSEHEKFSDGMIVHRALAFGDGHVMDDKAFALLEITSTPASSGSEDQEEEVQA